MAIGSSSSSSLRNLNQASSDLYKVNRSLSSGKRINSASDDAAGLAIASELAASVSISGQARRNIGDAGSVSQIADGALGQITDIGSRLSELAAQSANGTLSDNQRVALNDEFQALTQEASRITATTTFNGVQLLGQNSTTIQAGLTSDSNSQLTLTGTDAASFIAPVQATNISTQASAQSAIDTVSTFISQATAARGSIGATANRLDVANGNLLTSETNAAAARSRIENIDVAEASANRVALSIRQDVGVAIAASTRNSGLSKESVLKLLS